MPPATRMENGTAFCRGLLFNAVTVVPTTPWLGSGGAHPSLGAQAWTHNITWDLPQPILKERCLLPGYDISGLLNGDEGAGTHRKERSLPLVE